MATYVAVPFAGYEDKYLSRWMEAFGRMADGLEAEAFWLCNGPDREFAERLRGYAKFMPIPVEVMWEPFPVLGLTNQVQKNNAACIGHALAMNHLRKRNPEAYVFLHESDVIVPPGAIQRLRQGLENHTGIAALSGVIPEPLSNNPITVGSMVWRLNRRQTAAFSVPPSGPNTASYATEMRDGIEVVDALPFGALLTKLSVFEDVPLGSTMFPGGFGFDQEWGLRTFDEGLHLACDWGVWCGHIKKEFTDPIYEDLRERMSPPLSNTVGLAG